MAVNVHIAAVSLTGAGFTLAVAACVRLGLNISLELSAITGRWASRGIAFIGLYGVVQQAADSAHRLYVEFPHGTRHFMLKGLKCFIFSLSLCFAGRTRHVRNGHLMTTLRISSPG